jgi:hypothetical protein
MAGYRPSVLSPAAPLAVADDGPFSGMADRSRLKGIPGRNKGGRPARWAWEWEWRGPFQRKSAEICPARVGGFSDRTYAEVPAKHRLSDRTGALNDIAWIRATAGSHSPGIAAGVGRMCEN